MTERNMFEISGPINDKDVRVMRYVRWIKTFPLEKKVDRVEFTCPSLKNKSVVTFTHQPGEFRYDVRGYETLLPAGGLVTMARFTPEEEGVYGFRAMNGACVVEQGRFVCEKSAHPGFVRISFGDHRYFSFTDGTPFIPVGLNMVGPLMYQLPKELDEFKHMKDPATLGCAEYRRWFRELSAGGGNFVRLWLAHPYFSVDTGTAGEMDLLMFNKLDKVVELAGEYGIRLKLCFEYFRTFRESIFFSKTMKHPRDGRSPADMKEWFVDHEWQALWFRKVEAYTARYGNDPTIAVWELWNEIECCETGDWTIQRDWTRQMLLKLKQLVPGQMVVNSLGSYDRESSIQCYDDFKFDEMDFQQVHRYLDQGTPFEICRTEPVILSTDAVRASRRPDKPVLLAETGAVNDAHTGPFHYYRMDNDGLIFHDVTFPAFFAGAAGTGQIWHWPEYVDQKNLWKAYRAFSGLIDGIRPDEEAFIPVELSTEQVWFLALKGKRHILAWVRNRKDNWRTVLRDETMPEVLKGLKFDLNVQGIFEGKASTYWPWQDGVGQAEFNRGLLALPEFIHGIMVKIQY